MAKALNEKVGNMLYDHLVYDGSHPVDAKNVTVTLTKGTAGTIKRGQVIDFTSADGKYKVHAASGVVNCIAARDAQYTAEDENVVVSAYISGPFRKDALIATPALTAADVETFRTNGIFLK